MSVKQYISNLITIILACSALFITGLIIWNIFFQTTNTNSTDASDIQVIENWEEISSINSLQPYIDDQKINILTFYDYQCSFCK